MTTTVALFLAALAWVQHQKLKTAERSLMQRDRLFYAAMRRANRDAL